MNSKSKAKLQGLYHVAPEKHIKRLETLKAKRSLVIDSWVKAYDNTFPIRGEGLQSDDVNGTSTASASAKNARIYDGTLKRSVRMLASALMSGLTPASSRWFSQTVPGLEDQASKKWLDETSNKIWMNIHNCNFDTAGFECLLEYVIPGMFVMFVEPGDLEGEGKLYNFVEWPLASCYFADSTGKGMIDTVYRVVSMTAEQAFNTYGEECSEAVQKSAKDKPDEQVQILHAIYPRKVNRRDVITLPIASDHIEIKTKKTLRESGYHEMPVIVPRWSPVPNSVYSLGPVDDALPDHLTLNELVMYVLKNADMAIAGMWGAVDDGTINPKTVKVGPRRVIAMAGKDNFFPLTPGGRFDVAALQKAELQGSIKATLLSDQLHPEQGPQMTATEIHMRAQQIRQLLGPMYGRLQSEYMVQLVNRCFGIAFRAGILGDPPDELRGRFAKVTFQSPLAKAQKLDDVAAMDRHEATLLNQAQIGIPTVMDTYDFDKAAQERADLLGVPAKLIRDEDAIKKLRDARAREAKTAQAEAVQAQEKLAVTQAVANA